MLLTVFKGFYKHIHRLREMWTQEDTFHILSEK